MVRVSVKSTQLWTISQDYIKNKKEKTKDYIVVTPCVCVCVVCRAAHHM